jgi:crotonobetainyl-CoA:carnitine CoA-transferase CaiB-like acyl-CoA transferase
MWSMTFGVRRRGGVVAWIDGGRQCGVHTAALRRSHPHLTVTSITPFGLDGPWCDRPATEFTLQAWSVGIVGLGRGSPDRAPVFVGGQVGEYLAGTVTELRLSP